jgi:hypothetical protein
LCDFAEVIAKMTVLLSFDRIDHAHRSFGLADRMVRKARTVLHLDGAIPKGLLLTAANQAG